MKKAPVYATEGQKQARSEEISRRPHFRIKDSGFRPVNVSNSECRCGHLLGEHRNGDCLVVGKDSRFCSCRDFLPRDRKLK